MPGSPGRVRRSSMIRRSRRTGSVSSWFRPRGARRRRSGSWRRVGRSRSVSRRRRYPVAKRDRAIGRRVGRAAAVAALALSAGACTELDNTLAKVPFFAFMHESPAFDPYEMPRPAPPNAVPFASPLGVEDVPPIAGNTEADLQAFAAQVTNPLPMSDEVLAVGRQAYQTHCFVCHGATGAGDGPVIGPGRVPFALSVLTPRAREFSDGYLYGII